MTSSEACTVALFMKDTENVKNYCKTEVEPNAILPRAYHTIDGLWLLRTLSHSMQSALRTKENLSVKPLLGIIKLNMS